jgi:hypothetical protein
MLHTAALPPRAHRVLRCHAASLLAASHSRTDSPLPAPHRAQDDGTLAVLDAAGTVVWRSSDSPAGRTPVTQLMSGGTPPVACIHSGPQPAATSLTSSPHSTFQGALSLSAVGKPELRRRSDSAVVWSPQGFPVLPEAVYKLCISSSGTLQAQKAASSVASLWQEPGAGWPAAAGPYLLRVGNGSLEVLDSTCRRVYSTAAGSSGGSSGSSSSSSSTTTTTTRPPVSQQSVNIRPIRSKAPPPVQQQQQSPATMPLGAKAICGGVALCGTDEPCQQAAGQCGPGLACMRDSVYVWRCAERP